jgi:hypothetical protein
VWVGVLLKVEGTSVPKIYLRGAGNTQTKQTSADKFAVNFGDGWYLYAIDAPILSNSALICDVEQSGSDADVMYVGSVQAFIDGFEYLPVYHKTTVIRSTLPTTGTWVVGDYIYNSDNGVVNGSGGYATTNQKYTIAGWTRITNGTGNVLNTDWVQDRRLTGQ